MAKARWQESDRAETPRPAAGKLAQKDRWKPDGGNGGRTVLGIFAGLFALAAVLTVVVTLILYLYPIAPPRLIVIHADYHGPLLPPNTFADRDAQAIVASSEALETDHATAQSLTADAIRDQLEQLPDFPTWQRWLRWEKNILLVYVNAYGVSLWDPARKQSQPYLLGSDFTVPTKTGDPEQFGAIPFRQVLQAVVDCNADKKILVLDCQRLDHHWPMGMLQNDFITQAQVELNNLDAAKTQGLHVLFSCSGNETTYYDAEFGLSVFGRYFLEGLTGASDLDSNIGNGDGRVQFDELAAFVKDRVSAWTLKNRNAAQQPLVQNFEQASPEAPLSLVALGTRASIFSPVPLTADPSRQDVANDLEQAWQLYYQLGAETPPPYFYAPNEWRYVQETLKRCERFLLANQLQAAAQEARNALARISRVNESKSQLAINGRGYSVAMEKFLALSRTATASDDLPVVPPETTTADTPTSPANSGDGPAVPVPAPVPIADTQLADYEAVLRDLSQDRDFEAALARLENQTAPQQTLPVEILTVRMIQKYFLNATGTTPDASQTDMAKSVVGLSTLAETAAAPSNLYAPFVRKWTQAQVEQGDLLRRWKTDLLFARLGSSIYTQHELTPPADDDPQQHYEKALAISDVVTQAISLRQQLLAELPSLVQYAVSAHSDSEMHALLEKLLGSTRHLNEQLQADTRDMTVQTLDSSIASLRALISEAQASRSQILDRLVKALQGAAATSGPPTSAQQWLLLDDLLHVPYPSHAGDAGESANTRLRLLERLQQPIQFEEESAPVAQPVAAAELGYQARLAEAYIFLRNGRNVPLATTPAEQVGHELAQSWQQAYLWSMQETFATAEEDWLNQVDTATRLFDGFVAQGTDASCIIEIYRRRLAEFFLWHAERASKDFWASLQQDAEPYFSLVAGQYLLQAARYDPHGFLASDIQQLNAQLQSLRAVPAGLRIVVTPSQIRLVEQLTVPMLFRVDYPEQVPSGVATLTVNAASSDVSLARTDEQTPLAPNQVAYMLTRNARAGQATLSANVLFRGHRSPTTVMVDIIDDEAGPAVAYLNEKPLDATLSVRLAANPRSDANLLFVLDCSSSMDQNQRMSILQQVLRQFADGVARHAMNVGVRVLGDQVVWTEQQPEKEADARIDSRLLLPIGPFEPEQFEQAVSRLRPTGSTPLFYALLEARKDFENVRQGPKRIVVISDGADNWALVGRKPNIEDLREAYQDSDIEINTIGFQVGDQAFAQLQEIAAARGGVAVRASQADTLFKYVTGLQGAVFYSVVGESTRTEPQLLTTQSKPMPLRPGDYAVELSDYSGKRLQAGFPVRLQRGETHPLSYYRGVLSYEPITAVAKTADTTSKVTLSVLAAERREGNVRLRIAVYKPDQPAWRPDDLVIFLRPKGSAVTYPLQHLPPNVAGYHVGVWEFTAENWPVDAVEAEVEVLWTDAAAVGNAVRLQWGAQPVAGAIPQGTRIVYRNFEPRNVLGDRKKSAMVKVAFPESQRLTMSQWAMTFSTPISRAEQIYNSAEGIYTGRFVLDGETQPDTLLLHLPVPRTAYTSLKLEVGVSVPVIP